MKLTVWKPRDFNNTPISRTEVKVCLRYAVLSIWCYLLGYFPREDVTCASSFIILLSVFLLHIWSSQGIFYSCCFVFVGKQLCSARVCEVGQW